MDILGTILGSSALRAGTPGPTDDYWYQATGTMTEAGVAVSEETAQKLSAWYRGRLILAFVLAMLPLPVYRKLPDDGGSEAATDHPLYDVLHDEPNDFQDSFQWRMEKMFHLIDHGNGYDYIIPGARGFVHQLVPIDPTLVTPKQQYVKLANGAQMPGRMLYVVRQTDGSSKTFTQDEIFHLRGADGKGILEYARSNIGLALATESYASKIFSAGMLNGGVIENPGLLNKEAAKRQAISFATKHGEWHLPKVLEQGSVWKPPAMSPEDFEMINSRKFGIDDMARWLGVPRQMLENSDPSFGNAEQFDESFMTYSMGGWLSLFEFAIKRQLVLNKRVYYAEFTRDAIARGKLIDRWNVHVAAVNAGIKSVDEARAKEGLNKRGGKADELREPQNITGKPAAGGDAIPSTPSQPPRKSTGKAQAIVVESANRLLAKEINEIQKLAVRHAADQDAFAEAVTNFYAGHVERVMSWLQMGETEAQGYCSQQSAQVIVGDWISALEQWKAPAYAAGLAALALDEAA